MKEEKGNEEREEHDDENEGKDGGRSEETECWTCQ